MSENFNYGIAAGNAAGEGMIEREVPQIYTKAIAIAEGEGMMAREYSREEDRRIEANLKVIDARLEARAAGKLSEQTSVRPTTENTPMPTSGVVFEAAK